MMYDQTRIRIKSNEWVSNDLTIGRGCLPIVNASIGTSSSEDSFEIELKKARAAIEAGASMISDHSFMGDVSGFHKRLRNEVDVPLGTVPIYGLAGRNACFSEQQALEIVDEFLDRGFDLLTIHATALLRDVYAPITDHRLIPITSKGGRLMLQRMERTQQENPFFSRFDDVLRIFKKHDAVISLGPVYRPASVVDDLMSDEDPYWIEVRRMETLVEQAIAAEVPIIVEGIGHARMDRIPTYVKRTKEICHDVPYRVLSVSTDIALGYDNVASAIASSIAVLNGADIVTAVSASEHIGLPSVQQVEDAVVSSRIAIHSACICTGNGIEKDCAMSRARATKGSCQGSIENAIFPAGAGRALRDRMQTEGCAMCGELCALKSREIG